MPDAYLAVTGRTTCCTCCDFCGQWYRYEVSGAKAACPWCDHTNQPKVIFAGPVEAETVTVGDIRTLSSGR